jgi:hypothetical protein
MADLKEQHICIKYCFKLRKMLQYNLKADRKNASYDWFSTFKSGVTCVENNECSGCPAMSKTDESVDQMKELLFGNRRIAAFEVANVLGISFGSVDSILKDYLNMDLIPPYLCPASWVRSRGELCLHARTFKRDL